MTLAVIATVIVAILHVLGVSSAFGRTFLLAHAFGAVLCILLGELWMRTRFVTRELAILSAVGLSVSALVSARFETSPPYRAIAERIAPQLAAAAPAYPSFFSSEHNVLQGYLDRAGGGFAEFPTPPPNEASALKAYVLAPQDMRRPEAQRLLPWLQSHAREVTGELPQPESGYRVFLFGSQ